MKKYNTRYHAERAVKDWENDIVVEKKGGFYIVDKKDVISPLMISPNGVAMNGDDIEYELFVFRGKAIRRYANGHFGMGDEFDNSFIR